MPPTPKYPPTLPVVADGLVFIGTGDGHLFGYPTHCGTGAMVCEPTWIAHGDGQPGIGGDVVYGWDYHHLYAYPIDCGEAALDCAPLWIAELPASPKCCWSGPDVDNGHVYIASGNRVFGFPESCGTDGGSCRPDWIGATDELGGADHLVDDRPRDGLRELDAGRRALRKLRTHLRLHHRVRTTGLWSDLERPARCRHLPHREERPALRRVTQEGSLPPIWSDARSSPACKPVWTLATFIRAPLTDRHPSPTAACSREPTRRGSTRSPCGEEAGMTFGSRAAFLCLAALVATCTASRPSRIHRSREPAGAIVFSDRGDLYLVPARTAQAGMHSHRRWERSN